MESIIFGNETEHKDNFTDPGIYIDIFSRKPWETQESKYTTDDVIEKDFKLYLKRVKEVKRISFDSDDTGEILKKLGLLAKDGKHLLNAGAVLFCNSPMTDVQIAKFATDVKATFTDIRRETRGSIIGLSKICLQYIIDAMDWKADIIGLKRVETPEIPVEAVREAIINSYGHRLYGNNQSNEIDVFKDRIEIHTTGGFPKGHSPEEFLDGNKKAIRRNRLITEVLYYSKDMETFATGLKRIKDLCDKSGCKLGFRMEQDDFVVVFYRNLREKWNGIAEKDPKDTVQTLSRDQQDTGKTLARHWQDTGKTTLEKIKDIMKENPTISVPSIAKMLNLTQRGVRYHIEKMKASGELERQGGDYGGKWIIKK